MKMMHQQTLQTDWTGRQVATVQWGLLQLSARAESTCRCPAHRRKERLRNHSFVLTHLCVCACVSHAHTHIRSPLLLYVNIGSEQRIVQQVSARLEDPLYGGRRKEDRRGGGGERGRGSGGIKGDYLSWNRTHPVSVKSEDQACVWLFLLSALLQKVGCNFIQIIYSSIRFWCFNVFSLFFQTFTPPAPQHPVLRQDVKREDSSFCDFSSILSVFASRWASRTIPEDEVLFVRLALRRYRLAAGKGTKSFVFFFQSGSTRRGPWQEHQGANNMIFNVEIKKAQTVSSGSFLITRYQKRW